MGEWVLGFTPSATQGIFPIKHSPIALITISCLIITARQFQLGTILSRVPRVPKPTEWIFQRELLANTFLARSYAFLAFGWSTLGAKDSYKWNLGLGNINGGITVLSTSLKFETWQTPRKLSQPKFTCEQYGWDLEDVLVFFMNHSPLYIADFEPSGSFYALPPRPACMFRLLQRTLKAFVREDLIHQRSW